MNKAYMFLISVGASLISVGCSIQLTDNNDDQSLAPNTFELLSILKQCIVFIFDWSLDNDDDPSTCTSFFIFYSESLSCSLIVETFTVYRNKTIYNPRFEPQFEPHPQFTKYTKNLISLHSAETTSIYVGRYPATTYVCEILRRYNIPFNYVLLFMSHERFSYIDNVAVFNSLIRVSAPAVYISVLDEKDVYVVGFAHVLQSATYLFKVSTFTESHIQNLHQTIHKDLQGAKTSVEDPSFIPEQCKFGSPIYLTANDCAFRTLVDEYNMTFCMRSSCEIQRIAIIITTTNLDDAMVATRKKNINFEYINYRVDPDESSFICIVQVGSMGLMAFVQAFDASTWIVTAAACTFLTATVTGMSTTKTVSWRNQLQPSAVVVIMLLFERFYANAQLQTAATRQTILVLTLWAFGAMLLGMSYSGNMISELAAPSLPPSHRNMHELSLVEYPIYSRAFSGFYENESWHDIGFFHADVREYLKYYPGDNSKLTKDLQRFGAAITHVASKYIPLGELHASKSPQVLFAIADSRPIVNGFAIRSVLASSNVRVLPAGILPFFNNLRPIAVQTNSLLPIFRNFFANLCEAGICKYWAEGFNANMTQGAATARFHNGSAFLGNKWITRINLAEIWRDFNPVKDGETSWSRIAVDNMIPAFQLLGIGLLVATLVLINEQWPLHRGFRLLFRMAGKALIITGHTLQSFVGLTLRMLQQPLSS